MHNPRHGWGSGHTFKMLISLARANLHGSGTVQVLYGKSLISDIISLSLKSGDQVCKTIYQTFLTRVYFFAALTQASSHISALAAIDGVHCSDTMPLESSPPLECRPGTDNI